MSFDKKERKKVAVISKKKKKINKIVILQFLLKHQSAFIDSPRIEITVKCLPRKVVLPALTCCVSACLLL